MSMIPRPEIPRPESAVPGRQVRRPPVGVAWSVPAGAVTAIGLLGAEHGYGLLGSAALLAGISLLALVSVWSVADELHLEQGPLLRSLPLLMGVGTVVTAGWCDLAGGYGLVVVALVALASPWCRAVLRRRLPGLAPTTAPTGVRVDQAAVDRRFQGIVKSLGDEPGGSAARP